MNHLFDISRFMPHGHCYQWDPGILWTSVISDALIFAAYVSIPITLVFGIMRRRKDLPFNWMFVCFGVFIIACGVTHLMEIITVWKPFYPISAIVKVITALASVPTAIILYRIAPRIVQLPTLKQLVHEQSLRLKAEAASEAKDRFIAVLSHELRTPLTPVKAGLDLIEDELNDHAGGVAPAVREALRLVRRNVEMETTLINDLLDVSAATHGKLDLDLDLVDLEEVLRQSVAVFQDEMNDKQIAFDLHVRTDQTLVIGAAIRLHQVTNNLLSNAIKFTPEGGRITGTLSSDNARLRLSIQDTGRGIDAESLERIFQPFEQGERDRGKVSRRSWTWPNDRSHYRRVPPWPADRAKCGLRPGRNFHPRIAARGATATIEKCDVGRPATPLTSSDEPKPRLLLVDDHADTLARAGRTSAQGRLYRRNRRKRSRSRSRFSRKLKS